MTPFKSHSIWREFQGQNLFLTGGTGFFGKSLLESFSAASQLWNLDIQIWILSRDPCLFSKHHPRLAALPCIHWVKGDIQSFEFNDKINFSHVIHAATPTRSDVNTETKRILQFAATCKASNFLLTSSGAVYGSHLPGLQRYTEEQSTDPSPNEPSNAYCESKRIAEFLCCDFSKKNSLQVKIARCFALLGPYLPLDAQFAAGNFIADGIAGRPIRVKSDGSAYRSYLFADDLIVWLLTILLHGQDCRPYNVGSDEAVSILELAKKIAEHFDQSVAPLAQSPTPPHPLSYIPSIGRARAELGLTILTPMDLALTKSIGWHRKNP